MKLNFDNYKQDVLYNAGKNEKKIIEYITNNSVEKYDEILQTDNSSETILGLSTLRNNIVYAYSFKNDASILELGAHLGEVTNLLCKSAKKVVAVETVKARAEAISVRCKKRDNLEIIVGNFKDINFSENFDYITLFGVLEYAQCFFDDENPAEELIKYCKKHLKEDGKILIATDNKFAMKYYVGAEDDCTGNRFDSVTGYKNDKAYKLGKYELERILNSAELYKSQFFYPLPDYKLTNSIFSDEYLPTSSKINGYFPYYNDYDEVLFSEVDAYDAIIKENKNMFPFFANSFLVEASKIDFENDTKYVGFNNYRKKKYRLMTKIRNEFVEKIATEPDSRVHLNNMKKNIDQLKKFDIRILDDYDSEKISSKYVDCKLVSQLVSDNLENKKYIIDLLKRYKNEILKLTHVYIEDEENIFTKYNIEVDKEVLQGFNYLENGYWDMIFKNCFLIDNNFVFFDQEWIEKNIPAEFLVYRCIVNIEKLREKIEQYDIYEELGISEYISLFEELDRHIFNEIFDKKIFELYTRKHKNPIYENAKLEANLNYSNDTIKELRKSIQNLSNEIFSKDIELNSLRKFKENVEENKGMKLIMKFSKMFK